MSKENKSKISVVIPVYNVEQYLNRCVESIVKQTYKNLEIILVDDGSPDGCPAICDEWAQKDARIKVIHKPNGGLSDARNVGIEASTGEYISFIDSDDLIHFETYELLLKVAQENDADLTVFKPEKFTADEPIQEHIDFNNVDVKNVKPDEFLQEMLKTSDSTHYVIAVDKLYKKEIFNDLRFAKGKIHEDEFLVHHAVGRAKKISIVDVNLYYYYMREGSIIRSKFTEKRLHALEAIEDRIEYLSKNFPQFVELAKLQYLSVCKTLYCRARKQKAEKNLQKEIFNKFKAMYKNCTNRSKATKLFRYTKSIYYLLYKSKYNNEI